MRAFYFPAGLLAVILAFSLWTGRYVEERAQVWSAGLEAAGQAAGDEDWEAARSALQEVYDSWTDSQPLFHVLFSHGDLDEAETLFAGALAVCREADGADFRQLTAQLSGQMRLLSETQQISLGNIL